MFKIFELSRVVESESIIQKQTNIYTLEDSKSADPKSARLKAAQSLQCKQRNPPSMILQNCNIKKAVFTTLMMILHAKEKFDV